VARAEAWRLGAPRDPTVAVGPVITAAAAERIAGMVEAAVAEGATVATGGKPVTVAGCEGGAFFAPTVLTGVRPDHRIAREEVFGPVLAVMEVADLDEAIDVVNGVEYGLSAAVYTRDISTALRAVERIDTGIVYVNAPTIGAEIPLPFGGTKHTGNGFREAGTRGIEQFSQIKTVYVDYSGRLQKAQIDTHPIDTGAGAAPRRPRGRTGRPGDGRLAGAGPRRAGRGPAPLLRRRRRAGRGLLDRRRRRPALPRPRGRHRREHDRPRPPPGRGGHRRPGP